MSRRKKTATTTAGAEDNNISMAPYTPFSSDTPAVEMSPSEKEGAVAQQKRGIFNAGDEDKISEEIDVAISSILGEKVAGDQMQLEEIVKCIENDGVSEEQKELLKIKRFNIVTDVMGYEWHVAGKRFGDAVGYYYGKYCKYFPDYNSTAVFWYDAEKDCILSPEIIYNMAIEGNGGRDSAIRFSEVYAELCADLEALIEATGVKVADGKTRQGRVEAGEEIVTRL